MRFSEVAERTARRHHGCDAACGEEISPGQRYTVQRGWDGADAWTFKAHAGCRTLYDDLNFSSGYFETPDDLSDWAYSNPERFRERAKELGVGDTPGVKNLLERIERRGIKQPCRHAEVEA